MTTTHRTLVDLVQWATQSFAHRPAFGQLIDGRVDWTTYGQYGQLVDRFRSGLASLGIGRDDRVGVIANNRLEWAVACHACQGLGAALVPMYEAQKPSEWQFILNDSGAVSCLVANDSIASRLATVLPELPALRHVINMEGAEEEPQSYAALMQYGVEHPAPPPVSDPELVAALVYTSGTTGDPKGVVLTHGNLASAINSFVSMVEVNGDDRGVSFLPWAHVFGGSVELGLMFGTGGSTCICGDATRLTEYLPIVQPTILLSVPRVWNKIYAGVTAKMATSPKPIRWAFDTGMAAKRKAREGETLGLLDQLAVGVLDRVIVPKIQEGLGGRLRFAASGAAALSREVGEFLVSLGIEVHEGYGMTETCGAATAQPPDAPRLGTVGKALPGVRLELDESVPSADESEGELIIYGLNVMRGYYNRPDATRESMTEDGGLRTGDLARIDGDGYVHITGRVKELYKLENGKYVAPRPIEEKLELSPFVAQAMVTGHDQPHNVALIIAEMPAVRAWAEQQGLDGDDGALLSHPRIIGLLEGEVEKVNGQVKGYERIHDFVVDSEELTADSGMLTQTLKLKRRAIMRTYGTELESLYPAGSDERPAPRASYIRDLRAQQAS